MKNYMLKLVPLALFLIAVNSSESLGQGKEIIVLAKEFVDLLAKEDYKGAVKNFDETMTKASPPDKLKEVWKTVISQVGGFKKQLDVRTEKAGVYEIVFVTCEFEKAKLDIKIVFDKKMEIAGQFFVPVIPKQTYKAPVYADNKKFTEKSVTIGSNEWKLPGTLTVPKGDGTFPAIILVHGSGPNDRDETIGPNKPFKDLALGIASMGIAVLRYDKRTKVHADKLVSLKTAITVKEETIDDALEAVAMLRNMENIDKNRIFVLGHSLGGMLIPRIGIADDGISGFIILAGSTRRLEDIMLDQYNYIFSLDNKISDQEKKQLEDIERQVEIVKNLDHENVSKIEKNIFNAPAEYWLDLKEYRPAETAAKIARPILILQGERDYQVTMKDFQGWKDSLSDRDNVTFKTYPDLNHLFIAGKGKSVPAEYQITGNVYVEVINDIVDWIYSLKK